LKNGRVNAQVSYGSRRVDQNYNSSFGPGWYLDKVILKNTKTGQDTFFLVGSWLAKDKGDAIEIELPGSVPMDRAVYLPPPTGVFFYRGAVTHTNINLKTIWTILNETNSMFASSALILEISPNLAFSTIQVLVLRGFLIKL